MTMPELDVDGGFSVDLFARLAGSLDAIDRRTRRLDTPPPQAPVFFRAGGSVAADANGVGWVWLGGPDQGHFWYVRSLVVGGIDPTVATLGAADVFISAARLDTTMLGAASPSLIDWRDRATRLPLSAFYGAAELELRLNEELMVRFTGGTAGQQYAAAMSCEDHVEQAGSATWDM